MKSSSTPCATAHAIRVRCPAGKAPDFVGPGVFEIALRHRGNAYRVIYAVQHGAAVWVVDAFRKKSKSGIKTPQMDVDRIRRRLKQLEAMG